MRGRAALSLSGVRDSLEDFWPRQCSLPKQPYAAVWKTATACESPPAHVKDGRDRQSRSKVPIFGKWRTLPCIFFENARSALEAAAASFAMERAPVFPQGDALPDVKISQQVFWIMRTGPRERLACRCRPTPEKFHFAASIRFCGCLRPAIRLPACRRIYKALSETRREETGASPQNSGKARKCENCPDKEGSPRQFLLSASAAPAACGRLRLCKMPCLEVCLLVLQGFSSRWPSVAFVNILGRSRRFSLCCVRCLCFLPKGADGQNFPSMPVAGAPAGTYNARCRPWRGFQTAGRERRCI